MGNFKLGYENVKSELINMAWAWDKDKIWVPNRNGTHDLLNARWALYPLSYDLVK